MSPKPKSIVLSSLVLAWSSAASASTFYVATNGDDAASCEVAKNESTPKRRIVEAIPCLTAGDTLLIRAGVYEETINEYEVQVPSGASWSSPVTIAGYPGEAVTLRPKSGASEVLRIMGPAGGTHHVIFDNLILDAVNVDGNVVKLTYSGSDPANASHHIRISNSELMNAPGQGILGGTDSEFINLKVHDNGTTDFDHGIYTSGNNNLIEGCEFYRNAGWGIHKYPAGDNVVIRNNRVHDNARVGDRGVGIGIYGGKGNHVYNNLVWGNKTGIVAQYGESDAKIHANTIYGNQSEGIYNGADSANATIRNNLVVANGGGIVNDDPGTSLSANACSAAGDGCDVVGDPSLTAPTATPPDFHLKSGSPLIDQGADLTADGVTTDFDGVSRPQAAAFDIGAFEYCESNCGTAGGAGSGSGGGSAGVANTGGSSAGGSPSSGGATSAGGGATTAGGSGAAPKRGTSEEAEGCGCRIPKRSDPSGMSALLLLAAWVVRSRITRRRSPRY